MVESSFHTANPTRLVFAFPIHCQYSQHCWFFGSDAHCAKETENLYVALRRRRRRRTSSSSSAADQPCLDPQSTCCQELDDAVQVFRCSPQLVGG